MTPRLFRFRVQTQQLLRRLVHLQHVVSRPRIAPDAIHTPPHRRSTETCPLHRRRPRPIDDPFELRASRHRPGLRRGQHQVQMRMPPICAAIRALDYPHELKAVTLPEPLDALICSDVPPTISHSRERSAKVMGHPMPSGHGDEAQPSTAPQMPHKVIPEDRRPPLPNERRTDRTGPYGVALAEAPEPRPGAV